MSTFTIPDSEWLVCWGIDPGDEVFDQEAEALDGYIVDIPRPRLPLRLRYYAAGLLFLLGPIAAAVLR